MENNHPLKHIEDQDRYIPSMKDLPITLVYNSANYSQEELDIINRAFTEHKAFIMQDKFPSYADAMNVVIKAIKEDEGTYIGWQANIAMAFKDEWNSVADKFHTSEVEPDKEYIHKIANTAAKNFLNQLTR